MKAIDFYNKFINLINEKKEEIWPAFCSRKETEWTNVITNIIKNEVLDNTKPHYVGTELYRIDITQCLDKNYLYKEKAESIVMQPYCWTLEVAVEHENNSFDFAYELIKLSYIRCPLKVIISYNRNLWRDNPSKEGFNDTDFGKISEIIKWTKECNDDIDLSEEYLFIIGNTYHNIEKYNFDYRGYLYTNDELKIL